MPVAQEVGVVPSPEGKGRGARTQWKNTTPGVYWRWEALSTAAGICLTPPRRMMSR